MMQLAKQLHTQKVLPNSSQPQTAEEKQQNHMCDL